MSNIINGKNIAAKIEKQTAVMVKQLKKSSITPRLAVVLIGHDKPSETYVRRKAEAAARLGVDFVLCRFDAKIKQAELIEKIKKIQIEQKLSGIIIQLPLPQQLYRPEVLNAINPEIDVDFLTHESLGTLVINTYHMIPPAAGAAMAVLKELKTDLRGKEVVIVGAGALVGKPLANIMINERATVTVCNNLTRDLKKKCLGADIIITGVGKKNLIVGNMVKKDAIVIDLGIAFKDGKMYGDVELNSVAKKAAAVTPTPGGTGPITVAILLNNVVKNAKRLNK